MHGLIFRSNYFKNESAKHKSNYIKYLGTREGVEMNPEQMPRFFYEDLDMHGKKENYIDYISGRPGVEIVDGQLHGLFSEYGMDINLEQVMDEVSNHEGTVWINVLSLKREDAARLGYENVEAWQNLLRRHTEDLAKEYKIGLENFRWYAAFHNESYHPHVHFVVFSDKSNEGYLTKDALTKLKSVFANDIFKNELSVVYSEKSDQRKKVKEQARDSLLFSLKKLNEANMYNPVLVTKMIHLSGRLKKQNGKKIYGYLHKDIKDEIDAIVDEIAKIPEVNDAYDKWNEYQNTITGYYKDENAISIPLSKNKEFKSIKNMIIREAIVIGMGEHPSKEDLAVLKEQADNGDKNALAAYKEIVNRELTPEPMEVVSNSMVRLMKSIEKIFNDKAGNEGGHRRFVSDKKQKKKEKEKKIALGQKADDDEVEENNISLRM